MFIAQAFKYYHDFWRYLIGSLIVIIASFIGQIPFMIAVFAELGLKKLQSGGVSEKQMMTTLEPNLNLFLLLLSFVFAMAGIVLVIKFLHKQPFKKLTTSRKKSRLETNFVFIYFNGNFRGCQYLLRLLYKS